MPTDVKKPSSESKVPSANAALFVFATIADTTWRVFVPVLLGLVLGIWFDKSYDTVPFATITGTIFGLLISSGLVYRQIKQGLGK